MSSKKDGLPETGFVTVQCVLHRYAISASTFYLWVKEGRLPNPVKIGKRAVRVRVEDLRAFEATLMREACRVAN